MFGKLLSATVVAAAVLGMTGGAEAQPKKCARDSQRSGVCCDSRR